uniref:Xyloglucan endotransglucosylase/hydrolase n=1 Tax=Anthurium amnicola TaxID=1678845 RepID=A0A1D1YXR5_9ARAE
MMGLLGLSVFVSSLLCGLFAPASLADVVDGGLPVLAFEEGYTQLFGDSNLMLLRDGKTVHIALDERTGAGFASQDLYLHGFFSASIKLPSDYAAGIVVAFYMSNGDVFEKTHDELDIEFLGNIRGKEWRVQTNVYGNGSTATGREERYELWFDPTEDFHRYSILWSQDRIIFYIDSIPIREFPRNEGLGGDFPSKPMSLYATIWDGSTWATSGGRYKVNYKYAPFIAEFANLILSGCTVNPIDQSSTCNDSDHNSIMISPEQRPAMERLRKKHMTYSYCYDRERYLAPLPECVIDPEEAKRFTGPGGASLGGRHRHGRRHRRGSSASPADVAAL